MKLELSTDMRKNWFTLTSLVSRDFKLKYRRSTLGVLWSVLNPLLMMLVMTAVFSAIFRFEIEYYPLYLILGNIMFALMSDSTSMAMRSILDSASLIKKVRIEKMIFPLEKVLFQFVNFCISLIAVAVVMLVLRVPLSANIVFLPLLLVYVLMFSAGLGLLVSALAVFFRDVLHLWSVLLTAWTYATPIFYPVSILPEWMLAVMQFNPMYHYISYFRNIMIYSTTPGLLENAICLGMAALTLLVGVLVFRKLQGKFILYV